jgi:fatty acid desaturase
MTKRRQPSPIQRLPDPAIKRVRIGELKIFEITPEELTKLSKGDQATFHFHAALALIPFAIGIFLTLLSIQNSSPRIYYTYVIVCIVTFLFGVMELIQFWSKRGETKRIEAVIRAREMPEGIQEVPPSSGELTP